MDHHHDYIHLSELLHGPTLPQPPPAVSPSTRSSSASASASTPFLGETSKTLVCGSIAGVSGIVAGHPLDTIKVHMQTNSSYRRSTDAVTAIFKNRGVLGFYKGMLPPIFGNAPINALLFMVEHRVAHFLEDHAGSWAPSVRHLAAGAVSGLSQCIISCPTEFVKIQMQVAPPGTYAGPWDCTKKIFHESGLLSLYRGWWATVLRDAPAFAVYFYSYSQLKAWFMKDMEDRRREAARLAGEPVPTKALSDIDLGVPRLMFSGGMAGLLSWLLLHPVDVCKSLIQSVPHGKEQKFSSLVKTAVDKHGYRFLLRGMVPTCLRAFPASAVIFLVYEWCVHLWPDV